MSVWTAPTFNPDGSIEHSSLFTVFFNGILVRSFELKGETDTSGKPLYKKYDSAPIKLQAHGGPRRAVSFPEFWIRELN